MATRIRTFAAAVGVAPQTLPVPYIAQAPYGNLCWAACCAMICAALKHRYPQEGAALPDTLLDAAAFVRERRQCDLSIEPLDETCDPGCAMSSLGLPFDTAGGPIDAGGLIDQILVRRRPVVCFIGFNAGGAHVVLIVGYSAATEMFQMFDPLDPTTHWVRYESIRWFNAIGSWTSTYYNVGYDLD